MKGNTKLIFLILTALIFVALAVLIINRNGKTRKINDSITNFFKGGNEETVVIENPKGVLTLDITSPQNNQTVKTSIIKVQGKTLPKAEVFVNDIEAIADSSGNFSVSITLDEGENIISVSVNDDLGNYLEKEITVTLQSFD
jgi:hypothetical protein